MEGTPRLERTRGNGLRVVAIEPTPDEQKPKPRLARRLGLHRAVVDGLDVVAVGVEDEGAVVVLVVVRAQAGLAVVGPARGERGGVEGLDLVLGVDAEGEVAARRRGLAPGAIQKSGRVAPRPTTPGAGSSITR